MQINVNPHSIELIKTNDVNSGEYNIQECTFTFSSEYDDLTKMAIFTNEDSSYQTMIVNNKCIIPAEVLEIDGTIGLGVYGYETNGDLLIKRYSPKPVFFNVELGSYQLAQESQQPSSDIIAQILAQLETLSQDVINLQNNYTNLIENVIPTLATKDEIPDVSNFITKDVNDLTYYTLSSNLSAVATSGAYSDLTGTPDLSVYATTTQLGNETTARENADIGLQGQIDAITSSSDVKDIVGTYQDLLNYDTQHLGNNDVIKVLQDSTHNDAMTYYRWIKASSTWSYIGQEGPYYTKSEIDTTLQPYVKNTDYANSSKGGTIKTSDTQNLAIYGSGIIYPTTVTYENYLNKSNSSFIGKGTLENVITGKGLVSNTDYASNTGGVVRLTDDYAVSVGSNGFLRALTKNYTNYGNANTEIFISKGTLENVLTARIGDINSVLDAINGEVI